MIIGNSIDQAVAGFWNKVVAAIGEIEKTSGECLEGTIESSYLEVFDDQSSDCTATAWSRGINPDRLMRIHRF